MLLQIAFDKPEHLALLPQMKPYADIIEIGTPVLKRLGLSAIPLRENSARTCLCLPTQRQWMLVSWRRTWCSARERPL